ncbi:MAG: DEAD/DEAH box helicase family protein [Candidatus Krumholzibacteriia bacterium]
MAPCPFCHLEDKHVVAGSALAVAVQDGYPVTPGHTLVIPRRHIATWFEASPEEQKALFDLVEQVKAKLDAELHPDGYNIGMNVGEAAGQTVPHLHIHVIPRYRGDVDDPTGGVRLVIPERGNYRVPGYIPTASGGASLAGEAAPECQWQRQHRAAPLSTGWHSDSFLHHLVPLFGRAVEIRILAAFVQDSGVNRLERYLLSAIGRGAQVRLITGDYLNITQARALRHLLDLSRGGRISTQDDDGDDAQVVSAGRLEVRVVEVERIVPTATSFHPKSWIFAGPGLGSAFVGSSNLSQAALVDGVEWNLRVDRERDPEGFGRVAGAFEDWWNRARAIDDDWVDAYELRARRQPAPGAAPGDVEETHEAPPEPRDVQVDALRRLRRDREQGRTRALVVFATGLGKTWLAAFDVRQFEQESRASAGKRARVLFLAHRVEILRQAASTFRRLFPERRFGWYVADQSSLAGDVVLASVQKLARKTNLARLDPAAFDYVVVDEVHHADAATYRRIIEHLRPRFLLGLTATPDRADAGDIYALFDDHVAARADIGDGIGLRHLVPFRYQGLKDTVDYRPIPWRNGRFDPDALAAAVETQARMDRLWEAWGEHPGTRTLVFCCSISHAGFVEEWLRERGVSAVAVHSQPGTADRAEALHQLESGQMEAICAVDLFNEGVDVPAIDRVVMLRPTESPVLFLQQLGRGLRTAPEKEHLQVIDFVGNHRVFLNRVRTLLSLARSYQPSDLHRFVRSGRLPEFPDGCAVNIELEAIDLLRELIARGGGAALVQAYRELRASRDARPTIGELYRMGMNPRSLRGFSGWFDFVASEGDLKADEALALEHARDWLLAVEVREAMNKSYKMVALEAMLDSGALLTGMSVEENARRSYEIMRRSPELFADLEGTKEIADAASVSVEEFAAYWERWPLAHWAGAGRREGERVWFRLEGGRFEPEFAVLGEAAEALAAMTRELVEYRLARYRAKKRESVTVEGGGFEARVIWNQRVPILKLPGRDKVPGIPEGDTEVLLPDGSVWVFRFAKVAVNVARPVGAEGNRLPDLLKGWFGDEAGRPGTGFGVRFNVGEVCWRIAPVTKRPIEYRA